MRVLVANKFWYRRGGVERVMFDEIAWLEDAGHEVAHFSTTHPDNGPSPWSDYFVPYLELGAGGSLTTAEKMRAAAGLFSNREAARRFDAVIETFAPDIIHVHGIHRQISPSILGVARRRGIPVVQTLHDCHHLCPADLLFYRGTEPCEPRRCGTVWYGPCVSARCVRGSLAASALSAAETSFQRVRGIYSHGIARFISPSAFLAQKMREGGWTIPCDVVPNAIPLAPVSGEAAPAGGFCYIGRLAHEKGADVVMEAARSAGVGLTLAGDGPLSTEARAKYPEFTFLGHIDGDTVDRLIHSSRAVIVPSICYENAPMSVLEGMATGTPVIASALGGIPEQITSEVDGLLVPPGNIDELARAMRRCATDNAFCSRMGDAARTTVERRFSPQAHLEGLLGVYRAVGVE